MKNFTYTSFLMFLFSVITSAQTPQMQWANTFGQPTDPDLGIKLMPDGAGNLFFYGRFSGTVDFDPGPGVSNLTAGGNYDIVIGKYATAGNLLWIKQIGGSVIAVNNGHSMQPKDATIDSDGNLFITGDYVGIVDIDPSTASSLLQPHPTGVWSSNIFVASYTNDGDLRWGYGYTSYRQYYATWNNGYHVKIDTAGNVILSGMYHGTIDFDPSAATFNLTSSGNYMDVYFAKYTNAGNFMWAKTITGGGVEDTPTDMVIDSDNNIYLCGYIALAADFDPSAADAIVDSNGGGGDIFLAKYNASGDYQWAFSAGSSINYDVPGGLALDSDGNICMNGYFRGTVDFDPSAATFNLSSTGTTAADAFLSKYSTAGNLLWAKSFGGNNHENVGDMVIDQYGRIIVSGDFSGSCDFDPSPLIESLDAGSSPNAAFLAQFDNEGNFLNVMSINGSGSYLFDHGLVIDSNEMIYCTGGFEGTADFDPSPETHNLTSSGYQDIYMCNYAIGSSYVSGKIWIDTNSNGLLDAGELGLADAKIELVYDRNNNNAVDAYDGTITATTLTDGSYTFNAVAQGSYLLRVLPQAGFSNTTPLLLNSDLTAGQTISNKNFGFASTLALGAFTQNKNVVVYPNPVADLLTLSGLKGQSSLTVTDLSGKKLKEIFLDNTVEGTSVQISVAELRTGIYFLHVFNKDGSTYSTKLLKQ